MPGATDQCPAGQACGNDQRCSEQALACAATRCTPAGLGVPGSPSDLACIDGDLQECRDTDPVCGRWEVLERCTTDGRTCVGEGPASHCDCAEPGEVIYVDPGTGGTDAALVPTGAFSPAACRLPRLGDALAEAEERVGIPPSTATVMVVGDAHTFGSAEVSGMPIEVLPGITLTSADEALVDGRYAIVLDEDDAGAAVLVHGGAALSGFRIENQAGDATDAAVLVVGDSGTANLSSLAIDAGGGAAALGYGVRVAGLASLDARDVSVAGASVRGLSVEPLESSVVATFRGGTQSGNGIGAYVKIGRLVLEGVTLQSNLGFGIRAGELDGAGDLEMTGCLVLDNGGAGLHALNAQRLVIRDSTFTGNNTAEGSWATNYWNGTENVALSRMAGGLVLQGDAPPSGALQFEGNLVHSNRGDQVLVFGSNTTWDLSPVPEPDTADSCAPPTTVNWNTLACYDAETPPAPQVYYRGVVVVGSSARVRFASWNQSATPSLSVDFLAYGRTAGGTPYTVDANAYCPPDYGLVCP